MAAGDAATFTPEMKILDDFANFAYTWVGRSGLHRRELTELMLEFAEEIPCYTPYSWSTLAISWPNDAKSVALYANDF